MTAVLCKIVLNNIKLSKKTQNYEKENVFCLNLATLLSLIRISYSEWMMALPVILSEDNCTKDYLAWPLTPIKAGYGTKTTASTHIHNSPNSSTSSTQDCAETEIKTSKWSENKKWHAHYCWRSASRLWSRRHCAEPVHAFNSPPFNFHPPRLRWRRGTLLVLTTCRVKTSSGLPTALHRIQMM